SILGVRRSQQGQAPRFWRGATVEFNPRPDPDRLGPGHAGLHGAGAGPRRAADWTGGRRVLARLRDVRVPDWAARVSGPARDGPARQAAARATARHRRAAPRDSAAA